jgi:chromosome segregation ATPase
MKDHQQQTYVTKHDLELLHKKIIATDLIVQKYQDANKALLRLQVENDDLKQQIEQITNECCIFGKQVTECTEECDNLNEQIEILNSEKRELHQQVRLLQDENTNNYHEIMVLKQFESLKETNDQLTKTVDRQQKHLAKLQLQLQRKSPIVYKPNKKQEPSETDIALIKSEKSVRELKLALGRLVNFIQISKIEIPTALHIRPVLKAHEINDDFLEIEGDFIRKPVKKVLKPVVSQTDDDDDKKSSLLI